MDIKKMAVSMLFSALAIIVGLALYNKVVAPKLNLPPVPTKETEGFEEDSNFENV